MKVIVTSIVAGMALLAGSSAFAGQDWQQTQIARHAMEKHRAEQMAKQEAQRGQPGLAGSKGEAGRLGPTSMPRNKRAGRLPGEHP